MPERLDRVEHRLELSGAREDLPIVAVFGHVVGARLEDGRHERLFVGLAPCRRRCSPSCRTSTRPSSTRRGCPRAWSRTWRISLTVRFLLSVTRHDERGAPGAVALVGQLFVDDPLLITGAAPDRALDVVGRHVGGLRLGHDRPQARVAVDVARHRARRDGHFLDQAREHLAALGVERALLVLDRVPFGMARHDTSPRDKGRNRPLSYQIRCAHALRAMTIQASAWSSHARPSYPPSTASTEKPARSNRPSIVVTGSVRNVTVNRCTCRSRPALRRSRGRRWSASSRGPGDRLDQGDGRAARPAQPGQAHPPTILLPVGHVRHEVEPNRPPRARTRCTSASVAVRSRSRSSDCRMPYGARTPSKEPSA